MIDINCKYCQSENVIKYGLYKGVQRYYCKECRRKFAGIDRIPKMQYPTSQVSDAINMYYEGMSLKEIRRNFIQQHNDYISDVSALNWVNRFSKLAIMEANKYKPDVGSVWVADETVIDIDGRNIWFLGFDRYQDTLPNRFSYVLYPHHERRSSTYETSLWANW